VAFGALTSTRAFVHNGECMNDQASGGSGSKVIPVVLAMARRTGCGRTTPAASTCSRPTAASSASGRRTHGTFTRREAAMADPVNGHLRFFRLTRPGAVRQFLREAGHPPLIAED
jgi:hypothetical protein